MWRHRTHDHWTRNIWFPTGGQFKPSIWHGFQDMEPQMHWGHDLDYLGSRDESYDHRTRNMESFPTCSRLKPTLYLIFMFISCLFILSCNVKLHMAENTKECITKSRVWFKRRRSVVTQTEFFNNCTNETETVAV